MKRIAFTCASEENKWFVMTRYLNVVNISPYGRDVAPVILPNYMNEDAIKEYADMFDAFVFTGGCDVHPREYGEEIHEKCGVIDESRDYLELRLCREVLKRDKPVFGICRGVQTIAITTGGTLYQDIPSQISEEIIHKLNTPEECPSHEASFYGKLKEIIGKDRGIINSYHHQSVKTVGPGVSICAKSDDGVIEAISVDDKKYCIGVQWHPEIRPTEISVALMNSFLSSI